MILVDTTVWIDFFNNQKTIQTDFLVNIIQEQQDICICGVILTEILQGISNNQEYQQTLNALDSLILLPMHTSTFVLAADIFRRLRAKGVTIRKTIDCMIAAIALENEIALLHNDKDFDYIEKYIPLKTFK